MKLIKQKSSVLSCILFFVFALMMALTISNKINFHVDEISSYTLANHKGEQFLTFEDCQTYAPPSDVFMESMAVDINNRFDYANVIANQSADVHPPLYYLILHTICSLLPGTFSKWYAGAINIAFGLATLFFVRKLMRTLTIAGGDIFRTIS